MTGLLLIRVNCPDRESAEAISEALIAERLAPCTNLLGPIIATYVWQGEIETAKEYILQVKAHEDAWAAIEALVTAHHPAEVPAILALPIARANDAFAQWVVDNTDV